MGRSRIQQRIGAKALPHLLWGIIPTVLVVGGILFVGMDPRSIRSQRVTFIEGEGPVRVMSWDQARRRLTIIPLPADLFLEGMDGVGSLSIASIGRLEALDSSRRGLLIRSISEALAIPVIGEAKRLPLSLRFRLWVGMRSLRPDAIETVDGQVRGVFRAERLPDGSTRRVFDASAFDAAIGNRLEVENIRREQRRVRVVNTTATAGLGSRAARFFSRAGMVVVAVESERGEEPQEECTVHAREEFWSDHSVAFLKDVFGCRVTARDWEERADLTVRLGEGYARRFLPR